MKAVNSEFRMRMKKEETATIAPAHSSFFILILNSEFTLQP
jgi:hypothetical protein